MYRVSLFEFMKYTCWKWKRVLKLFQSIPKQWLPAFSLAHSGEDDPVGPLASQKYHKQDHSDGSGCRTLAA